MADQKTPAAVGSNKYDLTNRIAPFLDRHLLLPYLQFLQDNKVYAEKDLATAIYQLVSGTKMIDVVEEEYKKLHHTEEAPKELNDRRSAVLAEFEELRGSCQQLVVMLSDPDTVSDLRSSNLFTMEYLRERYQVTEAMLENLYKFAKLAYDCGLYRDAGDYLRGYRLLTRDPERKFLALWGLLACEILMNNLESAEATIEDLRQALRDRDSSAPTLEQVQHRAWLVHWSLFVYFNIPDGRNKFLEFVFNNEEIFHAIPITCPHLLRYLAVAVLTMDRTIRRKNLTKELVRVIRQEADNYSDPITEFVSELLIEFNFEAAREKLLACEKLLPSDFFLGVVSAEFLEQARLVLFETLARIHKRIDINVVAQLLDIPADQREQKIVELIRAARIDAKIDSTQNHMVMGGHFPSVYQQVIDKTRIIANRTQALHGAVEKRVAMQLADDNM